jgi:PAS domain S-box-containing protein
MKLRTKLLTSFGVVAFITLVVAGLGYWQSQRLARALHEVGVVRLPSLQGLNAMDRALVELDLSTRVMLAAAASGADISGATWRWREMWERFDGGWKLYEPLPQTPEEAEKWREFVRTAEAARGAHAALLGLPKGTPAATLNAQADSTARAFARAIDVLAEITALNYLYAEQAKLASVASEADMVFVRRFMLAATGVGGLVAALFAYGLATRICGPVIRMAEALTAVADGDLSVRVPVNTTDELGRAGEALNRMILAMRNSEAMLRVLSDNLPSHMLYQLVLEADGRMTFHYVSAGVQRLHGVSAADARRDANLVLDQILPEDRPKLVAARQAALENKAVFNQVVRARHLDGAIRWLHICSQPRRLPDGRTLWDGIATDITEAKRAEEALRESEARFRAIVDHAAVGIGLLALDGTITSTNPALTKILGYTPDESQGRAPLATTHPDDLPISEFHFQKLLAGEIDFYQIEKRYVHKAGHTIWTLVTLTAMRDTDGRRQFHLAQVEDITERKLAVLALADANQRLQVAIEVARVGLWRGNLRTGAAECNERMYEMYGVDPAGPAPTVGQLQAIVLPEDRAIVAEAWRKFTEGEGNFDVRFRIRLPDGEIRHLLTRGRLHRDAHGGVEMATGVNLDLTDFIRATEESGRLREQLRQAQKMETLGTLAAGVAHDFNNLLTGINGFIDLAVSSLPPHHEAGELLEQARQGGLSARDLVRRILAFARTSPDSERTVTPLSLLIQNTAPLISAGLPANVTLSLDIGAEAPAVRADLTQIQQLLLNLCVNGAHAIGGKNGVLKIALGTRNLPAAGAPATLPAGRYALLAVTDDGCGMAPEVLARVFEPFFTTKRADGGTGLGLSMAQDIVVEHGGAIAVRSRPGEGTTFEIFLPEAPAGAALPAAVRPKAAARGNRERILVVDDEPSITMVVGRALERGGYAVEVFNSPQQAWTRLENATEGFDLVLTDYLMPEMTGAEFAARIRRVTTRLPIMIMTARTGDLDLAKLQGMGGLRVLTKPFEVEELLTRVAEIVRRRADGPVV